MYKQLSIFDITTSGTEAPMPDKEGKIKSELLIPERWEAWKYSRSDWTMNGGEPYIINAILAILPGNRLYVKEWYVYPFMYELSSGEEAEMMYQKIRKNITERIADNNNIQQTWQIYKLPQLEDMYLFEDKKYSCRCYAERKIHGYRI